MQYREPHFSRHAPHFAPPFSDTPIALEDDALRASVLQACRGRIVNATLLRRSDAMIQALQRMIA